MEKIRIELEPVKHNTDISLDIKSMPIYSV